MKTNNTQIKEQDQLQILLKEINSLLHDKVKDGNREILSQKESINQLKKTHIMKNDLFEDTNQHVRTKLVVIKGYADMLQSQKFGALTPIQQEKITKIQESADELTELFLKILQKLKNVKKETRDVEISQD